MLDSVVGIIRESYILLSKMSIYLLFGFFFAGIIHIFLKPETISKHLGGSTISSVLKASLLGIPLPLCSCGVIPAALSLRKEGAGRGAVLSFLISTPTTGIDSIIATYALLGKLFAVYRIIVSFLAAFLVGILSNLFTGQDISIEESKDHDCKLCDDGEPTHHKHSFSENIKGVFTYAFHTLLNDTAMWLLIGLLIGGAISFFIPEEFIQSNLGSGWKSIGLMILIGMPMYVCASGSLPIVVALMIKGLNPGAAFAFLLAGPATNTVTMTFVYKNLGKASFFIYIGCIIICSFCFAMVLNLIWPMFGGMNVTNLAHAHPFFPVWFEHLCAVLLLVLTVNSLIPRKASVSTGG